jgi:hypothetical protein
MSDRLVSPACARPFPPAVAQRLDGIALRSPPLSSYLGRKFGYVAEFVLAAAFGAIAIACVLMIPAKAIDDPASRGCKEDDPDTRLMRSPCCSSTGRCSHSRFFISAHRAAAPGRGHSASLRVAYHAIQRFCGCGAPA